ncbi:MAG: hypothetical protein V3V08_18960 [Nannocystaceae bacterium]
MQSGINKIRGTIQYLRGIERDLGGQLHADWSALLVRDGMGVAYPTHERASGRNVVFLLDESIPKERSVLLLCLTVIEDVGWVAAEVQRFRDDRIADTMTADAQRDVLKAKGVHWNDLTPDNRTAATKLLRTLPFRALVAYVPVPRQGRRSFSAKYAQMLQLLLRDRMGHYDGCGVKFLAEEHSKVRGNLLAEVTGSIFHDLEARDSRRPAATPTCGVVSKGYYPALPLPDLVLGVVGDFTVADLRAAKEQVGRGEKKRRSGGQAKNRFEQTRHKLKAIYDLDANTTYSRRNPFGPWVAPAETGNEDGAS